MACRLSPGEALESPSVDLACCLLQPRRRPRALASAMAIAASDEPRSRRAGWLLVGACLHLLASPPVRPVPQPWGPRSCSEAASLPPGFAVQ